MKKWIALLLAVVMVLALSACSGKEEDTDASTTPTEASGTKDTTGASDATDAADPVPTEPSGTTGTEKESSSGDMTEDVPSTNADMEVDPSTPASAGDLTND